MSWIKLTSLTNWRYCLEYQEVCKWAFGKPWENTRRIPTQSGFGRYNRKEIVTDLVIIRAFRVDEHGWIEYAVLRLGVMPIWARKQVAKCRSLIALDNCRIGTHRRGIRLVANLWSNDLAWRCEFSERTRSTRENRFCQKTPQLAARWVDVHRFPDVFQIGYPLPELGRCSTEELLAKEEALFRRNAALRHV